MHDHTCVGCGAQFFTPYSSFKYCDTCTLKRPCPTPECKRFIPQQSSVCTTCHNRKAVAAGKSHRQYKAKTGPRVITCRGLAGCTSLINRYKHPRAYVCELCKTARVGERKPPAPQSKRRERNKVSARLKKYNLTVEQYIEMLERQGWVCAICKKADETHNFTDLCIDHDHRCCRGAKSCGRCVRGLVCNKCNLALGYLDDDPQRAQALAEYLREIPNELRIPAHSV